MADDVPITAGAGTNIATDDCTSGHVQLVKIAYSADGNRTHATVDANGVLVDLGANNDVSLNAGTNYVGKVRLTDGTNDATLSTTGALFVGGAVAHDGLDSGNPVKLGARAVAHGTNPTAVAAADRTDLFANRAGVLFTIGGHPNVVSAGLRTTASTSDTAILPGTIATGTKIVITRLSVNISNACTVNVGVKVGFGSTTLPADNTTGVAGVIIDNDAFPPGGGVNVGDGSGIVAIGGDGEELRVTSDTPTGGSMHLSYSYYTIES